MSYFKVTLYSDELLGLKERKKYIENLFYEYVVVDRNIKSKKKKGLIRKFNNALGFKDYVIETDNYGLIGKNNEGLENYSPETLIFDGLRVPIESFNILEFYIEKKYIETPNKIQSYKSRNIAIKWRRFLNKVYPHLKTSFETVNEIPKKSLRDFTFEYIFVNIGKTQLYTIEFESKEKLTQKDIDYIVPKIEKLVGYKINIIQYPIDDFFIIEVEYI